MADQHSAIALRSRDDWREQLRHIIFDHNTPLSRGFDIVLLWLIALAVLATMRVTDRPATTACMVRLAKISCGVAPVMTPFGVTPTTI